MEQDYDDYGYSDTSGSLSSSIHSRAKLLRPLLSTMRQDDVHDSVHYFQRHFVNFSVYLFIC